MTSLLYTSDMTSEPTTTASESCCSPAQKLKRDLRANAWLAVSTAIYLVSLYLLRQHEDWSSAVRVTVTLTPILPGILYFHRILLSFRQMDELQRRIQFEAWAFALAGTVLISTSLNVLAANGVVFEDYPHGLEMGGTYLTVFFLWSIGVSFCHLRYR
jgi:hypothetical protein